MDIKQERKRIGLSQNELSQKSGVARVSIARYESGTRRPTPETAKKLAAVLGVPWTKFFDDPAP